MVMLGDLTIKVDYIGYIAAVCTTFAFFPQAIQAIRTKDVSSISLSMYIIFCVGVTFWFVYGLIQSDMPVMLANLITLIPALTILIIKARATYRNRKK